MVDLPILWLIVVGNIKDPQLLFEPFLSQWTFEGDSLLGYDAV
jgi:hypothetical protein